MKETKPFLPVTNAKAHFEHRQQAVPKPQGKYELSHAALDTHKHDG